MKKLIIFVLTTFLTFTIFLTGRSANAELTPVTPFYEGDILNGKDLYLFTSYSATPNFENGYISKKTISQQDVYYQENSYFNGWYKNLGQDLIDTYTEPEHEPENPYFYFYITFNNMLGQYMQLALYSLEPFEADYIIKYSDNTYTELTASGGNQYLLTTPEDETTKEVVWLCWSVYYPDYLASFRPLTAQLAYDFGFSSGESVGYMNGHTTGYSTGYSTGYNNGYNEGYEDAHEIYTTTGVDVIVTFNQLIPDSLNNWITNGLTATHQERQYNITINTGATWVSFRNTQIPKTTGHRYFISYKIYTQTQLEGAFTFFGNYLRKTYYTNQTQYYHIATLNNIVNNEFGFYPLFYMDPNYPTTPLSIVIRDLMFIDLTEIYGQGNEPQTVDAVLLDFPSEYYPYTTDDYLSTNYETGFHNGYNEGYGVGLQDGKDQQATSQLTSTGWLASIFDGIGALLNIQILPGVTISMVVGIPFIISLAYFVIRAFRGGGGE